MTKVSDYLEHRLHPYIHTHNILIHETHYLFPPMPTKAKFYTKLDIIAAFNKLRIAKGDK